MLGVRCRRRDLDRFWLLMITQNDVQMNSLLLNPPPGDTRCARNIARPPRADDKRRRASALNSAIYRSPHQSPPAPSPHAAPPACPSSSPVLPPRLRLNFDNLLVDRRQWQRSHHSLRGRHGKSVGEL